MGGCVGGSGRRPPRRVPPEAGATGTVLRGQRDSAGGPKVIDFYIAVVLAFGWVHPDHTHHTHP